MTAGRSRVDGRPALPARSSPSAIVTVTAILGTIALLAFATVNVVFEGTGRFADGPLADYASGITVMNWLVVGLKLFGAAVLMLSVSARASAVAPTVMTLLLWGAFGTFLIYAVGTIGEAVAIAAGITGRPEQIDAAGVGYVLGAVFFATCFGVVAVSDSRRCGWRPVPIVLGIAGAPLLLAGILVLAPTLLVALGIMPPL